MAIPGECRQHNVEKGVHSLNNSYGKKINIKMSGIDRLLDLYSEEIPKEVKDINLNPSKERLPRASG